MNLFNAIHGFCKRPAKLSAFAAELQPAPCNAQPATFLLLPCRPDLLVFIALLTIFSGPTLFGSSWHAMTFEQAAVLRGEWWRLFTHPFVHLTWYHLLLDATAFLSIYAGLLDKSIFRRLACVIGGATGSLVLSCMSFTSPHQTLCGLSGIAHGLMAVSALEMVMYNSVDPALRRVGWISFAVVTAKAAFEAATGRMFFNFLNFGLLGDPVAVSHAGGVIGSLTVWLLLGHQFSRGGNKRSQENRSKLSV